MIQINAGSHRVKGSPAKTLRNALLNAVAMCSKGSTKKRVIVMAIIWN